MSARRSRNTSSVRAIDYEITFSTDLNLRGLVRNSGQTELVEVQIPGLLILGYMRQSFRELLDENNLSPRLEAELYGDQLHRANIIISNARSQVPNSNIQQRSFLPIDRLTGVAGSGTLHSDDVLVAPTRLNGAVLLRALLRSPGCDGSPKRRVVQAIAASRLPNRVENF